ncbi:hypothetical protein JHK87_044832 [Glycine soja]|nr:hypothetical protein JHK87_044832 [Glycine soja]
MDVVVKDVYGSWCLVLGGDGGVVGYCWDILARVPVEQVDVVGAMGVGRVKEEKGVVWHKIEKKVPKGRKEMVLDLAKFGDKGVQVKLTSGRQGCLPTLATIPVWVGLYRALSNVANEKNHKDLSQAPSREKLKKHIRTLKSTIRLILST